MTQLNDLLAHAIDQRVQPRVGDGGLLFVDLHAPGAEATVALQGAHLTRFQPRGQVRPLLWLSESARYAPGQSIRGGVPVCWPWFGAHPEQADWPAHGYARTASWDLLEAGADAERSWVVLRLAAASRLAAMAPPATTLQLRITVSAALEMELCTRNEGVQPVRISEALHSYFEVGDIARTTVQGLAGCDYLDKPSDFARFTQHGDVGFNAETDRVYLDTTADCVIDDPVLNRRIRIAKRGSATTVVWTPWQQRAAAMGDLGADGWRHMLCVESANAHANTLTLPAGAAHTLAVRTSVEPR